MTAEQGYRLVTRGIAAYFVFWAVSDLIGLPSQFLGFLHHWHLLLSPERVQEDTYWVRYYLLTLGQQVIRVVAMIWASGWFYRGSGSLRRFFLDEPEARNASTK